MRTTLLTLILMFPLSVFAAPAAELWPRWQAHDADSQSQINHSAWQSWLERYHSVADDGIATINYAKASPEDAQTLAAYIYYLEQLPISRYNRTEQKAYWINLYNALTIELVLKHYPVSSIRDIDISPGFFSNGPWQKKLLMIEEQPLSLDDIEHRILRPIWRDPRLHYALNCASISCPNLQAQAFSAANTEQLLEQAARSYINHPRAVTVESGKLRVSSIYKWFREDFGGSERAVIRHLQKYADTQLKEQLQSFSRINRYHYNWDLNERRD